MPVIKGQPTANAVTPQCRTQLQERLATELSGPGTPDGPLVFEIPLEQSDRVDVIVVWDQFEGVRVDDRDRVILDAYQDRRDRVGMVMGVTHKEADAQDLLPYRVMATARPNDKVDPAKVNQAKLDEGGIALENGTVDLRFPTLAMAEAAQPRLSERLPDASWEVWDAVAASRLH